MLKRTVLFVFTLVLVVSFSNNATYGQSEKGKTHQHKMMEKHPANCTCAKCVAAKEAKMDKKHPANH